MDDSRREFILKAVGEVLFVVGCVVMMGTVVMMGVSMVAALR
ncbi:hypothetical protein CEB3_c17790 [Peptococcaceae bacterium CEB3]|nr:hypothetical protein CEB3_c17790 [Peptococcaceae bacterium CEB3]